MCATGKRFNLLTESWQQRAAHRPALLIQEFTNSAQFRRSAREAVNQQRSPMPCFPEKSLVFRTGIWFG
jgi:hypothetical protein